jgi:hypothetical protein
MSARVAPIAPAHLRAPAHARVRRSLRAVEEIVRKERSIMQDARCDRATGLGDAANESKRAVGAAELHCAGCDGGYRAVAGKGDRVAACSPD